MSEPKAVLMTAETMQRALVRIAHEIMEQLAPMENVVLVGIRRRGLPLAQRLAAVILRYEGISVPVTEVDITPFRDDRKAPADQTMPPLPLDISGKTVVLVDDVLYTGRTVRAAMEALLRQGRPEKIRLAVLVDRGHRELPIRPDFIGKNVPTSQRERVSVYMDELDGQSGVVLTDL